MTPLAHGIDLVATDRIARMLEKHGDAFRRRCFTEAERDYCEANPKRRVEHYAARFAAKEAVLKALGTGWAGGITWRDVEVTRGPRGRPGVQLTGRAAAVADQLGIDHWLVSLSHVQAYAQASVIGGSQ
jgi:holo-[acyl-carrier protein] synthase